MPRKLPPNVKAWTDRHGRLRVYFRNDQGPRVQLSTSNAFDEFLTAYQDSFAGREPSRKPRTRTAVPGTIPVSP